MMRRPVPATVPTVVAYIASPSACCTQGRWPWRDTAGLPPAQKARKSR